ncbi:hypothetical protein [Oryza sativa Japonica Group]|uniref:Uncharacterized protein n=3 Tax=Oryza sativa subsp. japonica TaxID=39947 RepID=Q5QLF7_ORYSJ|nr:hypothetical protein [Oryza sativa Japonica Group]
MGNAAPRVRRRDEPAAKSWSKGAEAAGELLPVAKAAGGEEKAAAERAVVTVKVVMTRKEAERLAARLREQRARRRNARMAELKNALRAGDGAIRGAAAARPGPRGRAQSLAPIQERGFGVLGSLEWHPFWRGKRRTAGDNESDGDESAAIKGVAITDLFKVYRELIKEGNGKNIIKMHLTVDDVFLRVSVTELAGWKVVLEVKHRCDEPIKLKPPMTKWRFDGS